MVVVAEFVAGSDYIVAALTDLLTLLFGVLFLRDVNRVPQCILPFTIIAAFNFVYEVVGEAQPLLNSGMAEPQNTVRDSFTVKLQNAVEGWVSGWLAGWLAAAIKTHGP